MRPVIRTLVLSLSSLSATVAVAADPAGNKMKPDAEGYVRDWLVMSPAFYQPKLPVGEGELDKRQLSGEPGLRPTPGAAAKVNGQALTWTSFHTPDYFLDFRAYGKLEQQNALSFLGYAVAYVFAEKAVKGAELRIGSNDHVAAYWNGKRAGRNDEPRMLAKDQNITVVDVKAGLNVLFVKSVNTEQRWEVAARLVDDKGVPVPGLTVGSVAKPGKNAPTATKPDAEGFIRDWVVLAPVDYDHRPFAMGALLTKHLPNEGELRPTAKDKIWVSGDHLSFLPYHAKKELFIDFTEHARTVRDEVPKARWEKNDTLFNGFSYAVTYVRSNKDIPNAVAKIGANDHGRLWVNGKAVATLDTPGGLRKDSAAGKAPLRKGVNVLVFKVVNGGDAWQGSVRLQDDKGAPLTDLDVSFDPPGPVASR